MTPSTSPAQQRATGAAYRMCPRCRQPLTQPGETHLHDSQCVKACRSSIAALHDVLLQQSIRYLGLRDENDKRGALLWEMAHAAGGRVPVKSSSLLDGLTPKLRFENDEATECVVVVATAEPVTPAPN